MTHPGDRNANAAQFARLEDLHSQYTNLRTNLGTLQEDLAELRAVAKSPDDLIAVEVGPRGNLTDVTIKDRAYTVYSALLLSRAIALLARRAEEQVAKQAQELLSGYLPEGMSPPGITLDQMLRRQDERMERLNDR